MTIYSNVTGIASLIGDPTRTAILMALLDGRALPAGELARAARVSPQTASNHLGRLVEGGLLEAEAWGRHRYYRLSGPDVAKALESIASIAPPAPARSLRQSEEARALRFARTCYDHIAGELGVAFTGALVKTGRLRETGAGYATTAAGEEWLREWGVGESAIRGARHGVPRHVDWTERVHHMAGPAARAVTERLLELGWIAKGPVRRSIVITELGSRKLAEELGLSVGRNLSLDHG